LKKVVLCQEKLSEDIPSDGEAKKDQYFTRKSHFLPTKTKFSRKGLKYEKSSENEFDNVNVSIVMDNLIESDNLLKLSVLIKIWLI